jgi:hypothetical protein
MLKTAIHTLLFSTILTAASLYALAQTQTPEVDISTGLVTFGPLVVNQPFVFVNSTNTACAVSTPSDPNDQWFSPTPISVPAASGGNTGTYTVTATVVGIWTYLSSCLQQGAAPEIKVQ